MTNNNKTINNTTRFSKFRLAGPLLRRSSFSNPCKTHGVLAAMVTVGLFLLSVNLGWSASAPGKELADANSCPVNMVRVGPLCVDKYEASVWSEPPASDGRPRGRQFGRTGDDYPCSFNGSDCSGAKPIYAVPVPGRRPSAFITWFQAQQACLNVGKELPTNAEWQGAAAGTPTDYEPRPEDGVHDCNTSISQHVVPTGSRDRCVSSFGAFDMVGNLFEWTADWIQGSSVPFAPSVDTAGPDFGDDFMRGTNPAVEQFAGTNLPSALVRGGSFNAGKFSPNGSGAGTFALNARFSPATSGEDSGFRCVVNVGALHSVALPGQ
jgi:formylglycine-generating enzyme required for sulfatase activity